MNQKSLNYDLDPAFKWYGVELLGPDFKTKQSFYFRGLNRKESQIYDEYNLTDAYTAGNYLVSKAVVQLKDVDVGLYPQGTIESLVYYVLFISARANSDIWRAASEHLDSELGQLEAKAVAVLPGVTFSTLMRCDSLEYALCVTQGARLHDFLFGSQESAAQTTEENIWPSKPGEVGRLTKTSSF